MQADQLEILTPFLIERLRNGDDLRDGIVLRASELLNLPTRPVWSGSITIDGAKDAWKSNPLTAKRGETGEDWARMLKPMPPVRRVTDLANLSPRVSRPFFVSLLSVLSPQPDEISVSGVGAGTVPARPEPGVPRARAAGVAALIIYWRALRRFAIALPPDVARAAGEVLRIVLADQLTSTSIARLDEPKAERAFIKARRDRVELSVAKRVAAHHDNKSAPRMSDVAFLFAYPSERYLQIFNRFEFRTKRPEIYRAYMRGGAFDDLRPRLSLDGVPKEPTPIFADGAGLTVEGDRKMDVGLASTVPLVIRSEAMLVPRATISLRATLVYNDKVEDVDDRSVSGSHLFRWVREPRGGIYRVRIEAFDADGTVVAVGRSGELHVTQFAHCVRCSQKIDFSRLDIDERVCAWRTSPRPGTLPSTVSSENLHMLTRYGSNERVRQAATAAFRRGQRSGEIIVAGESAAPSIDYLGAHSPDRRLPDMPSISEVGRFLRGSLVDAHRGEMLALEIEASDRSAPRDARNRSVELLRLRLEGRESSDSSQSVDVALQQLADRLVNNIKLARANLERFKAVVDELHGTKVPIDEDIEKPWRVITESAEQMEIVENIDVQKLDEPELRKHIDLTDSRKILVDDARAALVRFSGTLVASIRAYTDQINDVRTFLNSTIGNGRLSSRETTLGTLLVEGENFLVRTDAVTDIEATLSTLKAEAEKAKAELDQMKQAMETRLAQIEGDRQAMALATSWNARVGEIVSKIELLEIAPSVVARGKDFVTNLGGVLDREDAEKVRKEFDAAKIEYKNAGDVAKDLFDDLKRFTKKAPRGVDSDVSRRAADALREEPAKFATWADGEKEAEELALDWGLTVGSYFDDFKDASTYDEWAKKLMADLVDRDLIEADDFDDQMLRLEDSGRVYRDVYDRLIQAAHRSGDVAKRFDATLIPQPSNPLADFEAVVADTQQKRAEFLADKARRANETVDAAKQRRLREFKEAPATFAFDAALGALESNARAFEGKRIAANFAALIVLDDELREAGRLMDAVRAPSGMPSDEAEELLRGRKETLKDAENVRRSDRWKIAVTAEVSRLRTLKMEMFLQKSPEKAEEEKTLRLGMVRLLDGVIDRTEPFLPDIARLRSTTKDMRAEIELNGSTAVSRLNVQKLAQEFIADLAEAATDLASDPQPTGDLEEIVTSLIENSDRRRGRLGALSATNDELREANGKHARSFSEDQKQGLSTDATSEASTLFVDYSTDSATDEDARLAKVLNAIEQDADITRALGQIARLPQEGETFVIAERIRKRRNDLFGGLEARIETISAPSVQELARDRAEAVLVLSSLELIQIDIDALFSTDPTRGTELLQRFDEKKAEILRALEPAREKAFSRIESALTLSRYGGDEDAGALVARNFLHDDDSLYGRIQFPSGWESEAGLVSLLNKTRGNAVGPDRCKLTAYVSSGALTCALDSIVMLAARADPQIMGRLLASKPDDPIASDVSSVLRRIDDRIGRGETSESTCDDLRNALIRGASTESIMRSILYNPSGQPKDMLDVADVLEWMNGRYEIEPVQLVTVETTVPEPTPETPVPIGPHSVRHQLSWPYKFASDLFTGAAFHDVQVETPSTAPRSFSIRTGLTTEFETGGSRTVDGLVHLAKGGTKLEVRFERWGWVYELVAIVHHRPGHYWISARCAGDWFRYDGTKRGQGQLRKIGDDPRDSETLATMHMLFYERTMRMATTGAVVDV